MKNLQQKIYKGVRYLQNRIRKKTNTLSVSKPFSRGFIDDISIESTGLIRVYGWLKPDMDIPENVLLRIDGENHNPSHSYRIFRPDVTLFQGGNSYQGIVFEYLPFVGMQVSPSNWSIIDGKTELWNEKIKVNITPPHYHTLFNESRVRNREQIYGSGPPGNEVAHEVLKLSEFLPDGKILDFGCGSGALIRALRQNGKEASGVEINRQQIAESIKDDVRPHIKLYDGQFPLPFNDAEFSGVIAVEVIEHIPNWQEALSEIARVCGNRFIMTVPDMSAIPTLFPHGVVPWHLLEATHFNFFNQTSLQTALEPYFKSVKFARMGKQEINGTSFFTSLVAIAEK